jgi:hypothetical protein
MVNTNYAAQLWGCCDRFPLAENQIAGAASATLAFLEFYVTSAVKEELEPELFRKKPMSMFQHKRVFGVAQLPGVEKDVLQWTEKSKHIVVQTHNSWYSLEIMGADNTVKVSMAELYKTLEAIAADAKGRASSALPMQTLTCQDRTKWAHDRNALLKDPVNAASLHAIETSLMATSIMPEKFTYPTEGQRAIHFLVGGDVSVP